MSQNVHFHSIWISSINPFAKICEVKIYSAVYGSFDLVWICCIYRCKIVLRLDLGSERINNLFFVENGVLYLLFYDFLDMNFLHSLPTVKPDNWYY